MWDDAKALSGIAITLIVMASFALCATLVAWLARQDAFALREVVVTTPLERTSAPHLEAAIREHISGTFFTVDLERARAALGAVPWVRSVGVRRHWPGRLEVAIEEHTPFARYGDATLVNTQGEVFTARFEGALPRFQGPEGRAAEVAARYREWSAMLAPLDFEIAELTQSNRGAWRIRAIAAGEPLTLELGRDDPTERLARFTVAHARTLGALGRAGTRVAHVDLRYRNGFTARVPGFREGAARAARAKPASPGPAAGARLLPDLGCSPPARCAEPGAPIPPVSPDART